MNLVLNHGIFGFATFHEISYFNGVREHLITKFPGVRILVAQVPPAGTIIVRGTELGRQILQALQPGGILDPSKSIHIIAHSMGGLDARFLLSPDNSGNLANLVVSLTTISTPHRGSPIADLLVRLLDPLNIGSEEKMLAQILRDRLSSMGIEIGGLRNLTTEKVSSFNDRFRDNESTKKFSVAGVGRGKRVFGIHLNTCAALRLAYTVIKEMTGEDNDGLVSLSSATWGSEPELWFADHADEIGHDLDQGLQARPSHLNYLSKYEAIVDRLRQL
jgi:triacylglycerol lipase